MPAEAPTRILQQDTVGSIPISAHAETAIFAGGCFWPVSFAAAPVAARRRRVGLRRLGLPALLRPQHPAPAVHITSASESESGLGSATAAGDGRATPVSLEPHIADADLQAVVNKTHEVCDIDADDLRDLLQRLEARIGAR
jgi:hypothetical protein